MSERKEHTCGRCGAASKWPGICGPCAIEDFSDHDDGEFGECDGFDDCGLMPDGQCTLAGTEYCDWDCGGLA